MKNKILISAANGPIMKSLVMQLKKNGFYEVRFLKHLLKEKVKRQYVVHILRMQNGINLPALCLEGFGAQVARLI